MLHQKGKRGDTDNYDPSDNSCRGPKFAKYDSAGVKDVTKDRVKSREVVLGISKSVVSLASTVGGKRLFACTGTVVDHEDCNHWILTSATLVRKPGTQYEAYESGDIKIEVLLYNKVTVEGSLIMCDLQFNVAVVIIESSVDFPVLELSDIPGCYTQQPRPVIAVGRNFDSQALLMRCGDMIRKISRLDCNELLVCNCPVNEIFIGGPIVDFERRIIGITFFDDEFTPFLPVEIAARCLKHFKKFKTLRKPWLHIKGRALHMLDLSVLENICCKYAEPPSGILVEKICEVPPANLGGIEVGDVISELDGVVLHSVAQFTRIFLDSMEVVVGTQNAVILQAVIQRPRDQSTFVAKLNVKELTSGECDKSSKFNNRWPLLRKNQYFM